MTATDVRVHEPVGGGDLCPVCSAHLLRPAYCLLWDRGLRTRHEAEVAASEAQLQRGLREVHEARRPAPAVLEGALPIVTVEAKRVGVVKHVAGPLRWEDWRAVPLAMEMECERFARAHDTPLRRATHYWWGVRVSRRVWVMPHPEPQVLVAEDYVRGDATWERLRAVESRALRALFRQQVRLQAWRVRDDEGQREPASVLWTVRLEQDGYPMPPEARTPEDRRAFRQAVESLVQRHDWLSWAPEQQTSWRP